MRSPWTDSPIARVDSLSREAEPPSLPPVVPLACHIGGSITVPSGQPRSLGSADDLGVIPEEVVEELHGTPSVKGSVGPVVVVVVQPAGEGVQAGLVAQVEPGIWAGAQDLRPGWGAGAGAVRP